MSRLVRCIHCHHLALAQGKCAETGQKITMPARPIRCVEFVPFAPRHAPAASPPQQLSLVEEVTHGR